MDTKTESQDNHDQDNHLFIIGTMDWPFSKEQPSENKDKKEK
jgi:hypothetical protein